MHHDITLFYGFRILYSNVYSVRKMVQNNKNIANIATYCSSNVREIGCRKTGCRLKGNLFTINFDKSPDRHKSA